MPIPEQIVTLERRLVELWHIDTPERFDIESQLDQLYGQTAELQTAIRVAISH